MLDLCLGSILWNWNLDDNVGGKQLICKVGNNFQVDGNPSYGKRTCQNYKFSFKSTCRFLVYSLRISLLFLHSWNKPEW